MALMKCPECANDISEVASTCPDCGCPKAVWLYPHLSVREAVNQRRSDLIVKGIGIYLLISITVGILGLLVTAGIKGGP